MLLREKQGVQNVKVHFVLTLALHSVYCSFQPTKPVLAGDLKEMSCTEPCYFLISFFSQELLILKPVLDKCWQSSVGLRDKFLTRSEKQQPSKKENKTKQTHSFSTSGDIRPNLNSPPGSHALGTAQPGSCTLGNRKNGRDKEQELIETTGDAPGR